MTLLELILSMAIFLGIMAMVFGIFIYGTKMFQQTSFRQGLEGDARRIAAKLRKDIALSSFQTVSALNRTTTASGPTLRRDAYAVGALSDWSDSANFRPGLGLPRWNQYIVCYATLDPEGRLLRQVISPTSVPSDGFLTPYAALSTNLANTPSYNSDVANTTTLSNQIESFQAEPDLSENTVTLTCSLRRRQGQKKAGTNKEIDESFEFRLLVKAKNTWPDI